MEIGSEISNKIRSAIKAKLVELGAYVDDELPDYIMVMVANKKTRLQMTEDLNLFLGANTDKFTSWLHGLISKLQTISGETPQDEQEEKKKEKVEKKKEEKSKEKAKDVEKKKTVEKIRHSSDSDHVTVPSRPEKPRILSTDTSSLGAVTAIPAVQSVPIPPVVEAEEPEFTVRAETDEFIEEMKELEQQTQKTQPAAPRPAAAFAPTPATIPATTVRVAAPAPRPAALAPTSAVRTTVPVARTTTTPAVAVMPTSAITTTVVIRDKPPSKTADIYQQMGRRAVSQSETKLGARAVTASIGEPVVHRTAVMRTSLKRKTPSSVVATVLHTPEEEEEEYDPHNPSVGNVASVVRVTARKSSVPRSLQANKSLLLRAMTDAEKSVANKRTVTVAQARQDQGDMLTMYADSRTTVTRDRRRGHPYRRSTSGLVSRSKKQEIMRNMKYMIENKTPDDPGDDESLSDEDTVLDNRVVEVEPKIETEEEQELASSPEMVTVVDVLEEGQGDSHVVIQEEGEPEGVGETEVEEVVEIPEILEQEGTDEFSHVLAAEEAAEAEAARVQQEVNSRVVKDTPKNTKFIVTLDGVDPDQYENMEVDGEEQMRSERVTEVMSLVTPPKIKPFNISLKDSDDEEDQSMTPLKKAKMSEKCRFWPACVNGNSCEYHHPTVPCKTFPSCKFGDKCLFIHPNCKYDSRCSKTNCPYTHATRRKPVTISPPQVIAIPQPKVILAAPPPPPPSHPRQVTCKFFPNCHNMKCPFRHPKPCRYGLSCGNKKSGCPFFHPALPTKDKLKWNSNKKLDNRSPSSSDGIKAS